MRWTPLAKALPREVSLPVGKPLVLGVEGWVYGCRMISYRARCQHGALGATSRCVILAGPSHAVRPING